MNPVRLRFLLSLFGLLLALVAVLLNDRRVTWVAIVVLGIAVGLRFASRRAAPPDDNTP